MSAQPPSSKSDSQPNNPSQQAVKQKCYNILQSNHQVLWQNFTLSILNHINYSYNAAGTISENEIWIKQEIESILKWLSNPKNKALHENYKMREYRWGKQRKEWQTTFQKQLRHEQEIKQKYEQMLQQADRKYRKVEASREEMAAKNSVLQSLIKSYQLNFNSNPPFPCNPASLRENSANLVICNSMNTRVDKKIGQGYDQRGNPTQDTATMTAELLPHLDQNYEGGCAKSTPTLKQSFTQTQQNKQAATKSLRVCSPLFHRVDGLQKDTQTLGTQTKIYPKLVVQKCVYSISGGSQVGKEKQIASKRQTDTTEYQENQLDQSSSSSSSYVLECDRGTQTLTNCIADFSCQTEPLEQKKDTVRESMLASLLVKLSQLQAEIENKNQLIDAKNKKISQMEDKLEDNYRRIAELKDQMRIAAEIEMHISEKYEESKLEQAQMQEKYQEVLGIVSNYLSSNQRPSTLHQSSQTDQAPVKIHSELKSDSQDDQPLTTESEQLDHFNPISMVDKSTIVRYLLEFIKFEIQGVNIEKRAAVLVTLMSVLEVKVEEQALLQQYMAKRSCYTKMLKKQDTSGIEHKLFKYLTDEN